MGGEEKHLLKEYSEVVEFGEGGLILGRSEQIHR
jgi:hypothetical protein